MGFPPSSQAIVDEAAVGDRLPNIDVLGSLVDPDVSAVHEDDESKGSATLAETVAASGGGVGKAGGGGGGGGDGGGEGVKLEDAHIADAIAAAVDPVFDHAFIGQCKSAYKSWTSAFNDSCDLPAESSGLLAGGMRPALAAARGSLAIVAYMNRDTGRREVSLVHWEFNPPDEALSGIALRVGAFSAAVYQVGVHYAPKDGGALRQQWKRFSECECTVVHPNVGWDEFHAKYRRCCKYDWRSYFNGQCSDAVEELEWARSRHDRRERGAPLALSQRHCSIRPDGSLFYGAPTAAEKDALAKNWVMTNHVQDIIDIGLENAMCFRHDAPRAIQKLVKTAHNEFHDGSASTFIELLDTTEDTVVAWRQHMMDNEMTKEGCPKTGKYIYESLCADFRCAFKGKMDKACLWPAFKSRMESHCDFLRRGITNEVVAKACNQLFTHIIIHLSGAIEIDTLHMILVEALDFAAPMESDGSKEPRWIFKTNQGIQKIRNIKAPMSSSKVLQGSTATTGPTEGEPDAAEGAKGSRQTLFLDDLARCITQPLTALQERSSGNGNVIQKACLALCFKTGPAFARGGQVNFNGQVFREWSPLRKEFRGEIIRAHRAFLATDSPPGGAEHATLILEALDAFAQQDLPHNDMAMGDENVPVALRPFVDDGKFIAGICRVCRGASAADLEEQPLYLSMCQAVCVAASQSKRAGPSADASGSSSTADSKIDNVTRMVQEVILDNFDDQRSHFGRALMSEIKMAGSEADAPAFSALRRRPLGECAVKLIQTVGGLDSRAVVQLEANAARVAARDLALDDDQWTIGPAQTVAEAAAQPVAQPDQKQYKQDDADKKTDVQVGRAVMALSKVRAKWAVGEFEAPHIASFMKHLERFVFDAGMLGRAAPPKKDHCEKDDTDDSEEKAMAVDVGLDIITADVNERAPELKTFDLSSKGYDSFKSSFGFCPAWMVKFPPTSADGKAKKKIPSMECAASKLMMPYTHGLNGKPISIKAPVTMHELAPNPDFSVKGADDGKDIIPARGAAFGQIKVDPVEAKGTSEAKPRKGPPQDWARGLAMLCSIALVARGFLLVLALRFLRTVLLPLLLSLTSLTMATVMKRPFDDQLRSATAAIALCGHGAGPAAAPRKGADCAGRKISWISRASQGKGMFAPVADPLLRYPARLKPALDFEIGAFAGDIYLVARDRFQVFLRDVWTMVETSAIAVLIPDDSKCALFMLHLEGTRRIQEVFGAHGLDVSSYQIRKFGKLHGILVGHDVLFEAWFDVSAKLRTRAENVRKLGLSFIQSIQGHNAHALPVISHVGQFYPPSPALLRCERVMDLVLKRERARLDKNWADADAIRDQLKRQGVQMNDREDLWQCGPMVGLYDPSYNVKDTAIRTILQVREDARQAKDYAISDTIRGMLAEAGIEIKDREGYWYSTRDDRQGSITETINGGPMTAPPGR
ncbi:unnamed protein product [Prorocentrum cordatum]|uniref:Uncharacterized protein n=1 Tax=Prorocentrum cordatum TaxID=2364126 RepID=A0ABN9Q5T5_9DINO|nr:unnamed protein product [Polarella glacialis]